MKKLVPSAQIVAAKEVLRRKKEELSRVGSLNLANFPYFKNDSKYMIALCQYDMGRFVRVGWKNP